MIRLERAFFRASEVAQLTGLSLRTIRSGLAAGTIPSRKIGDSRLIPASWVYAESEVQASEIVEATRERTSILSRVATLGRAWLWRQMRQLCATFIAFAYCQKLGVLCAIERTESAPSVRPLCVEGSYVD